MLCLFVWSPDEEGNDEGASWAPGEASRVWLHHSWTPWIGTYGAGTAAGVQFVRGEHAAVARRRRRQRHRGVREREVRAGARGGGRAHEARAGGRGIELITLPGHLLFDGEKMASTWSGAYFGTLMPFVHAAEKFGGKPGAPSPAPPTAPVAHSSGGVGASTLESLGLIPPSDVARDWSAGLRAEWDMSESGATEAWAQFKRMGLAGYEDGHGRSDLTAKSSTSALSPYLRFGQLSPRRVYAELRAAGWTAWRGAGSVTFWHRLYRREFAYWQLGVFPELAVTSWRSHYESRGIGGGRAGPGGGGGFASVAKRRRVSPWSTRGCGGSFASWMHQTRRMLSPRRSWWTTCTYLVPRRALVPRLPRRRGPAQSTSMMWQKRQERPRPVGRLRRRLGPRRQRQDPRPRRRHHRALRPGARGFTPGHLRHRPWEASLRRGSGESCGFGDTYPSRIVADVDAARARMLAGVLEVRAREVAHAAAAAASAGSRSDDDDDKNARRTGVLVDVF